MTRQEAIEKAAEALAEANANPGSMGSSGFLDIADHWIRLATLLEA